MFDINDFFDGVFGTQKIGDPVVAQLDEHTSVKGILKALPNATMGFCVVDGVITRSGVETKDSKILVPQKLIRYYNK